MKYEEMLRRASNCPYKNSDCPKCNSENEHIMSDEDDMVDRVAMAIRHARLGDEDIWGQASAAIEVMRKPTKEMIAAATWPIIYDSGGAGVNRSPDQVWELMIAAALGETEK